MWRNFRFLLICHVQKFGISPHDRFFLHGHCPCVRDKYEVCAYVPLTLFNIECKLSQPQILWSLENRLTDYGSNLYSRIMSSNIATLTPMTKIPTGVASFCFRCGADKTATNFRFLFSVFLSFCISAFQVGLPNCQFLFINFGFL